ncbi:caspase family protein [Methylobacterium dankookense]|uniref:Caspase family p20 domain-containing protein n=1 Tax=Methylobacterium dankookense TaxID=560405 RepID=A0A564FTB3_9HYPH|nr:caspase family protein [Methylobacterium dankookense]GJD57447.1 hypothetical protein IFDJLNFL_3348 [Methylobacterium dankookense]VUF11257.1 hypothetical protein MTDSW087_00934 [Methylobacterium dankookense]
MLKALVIAAGLCLSIQASFAIEQPSASKASSCDRLEPAASSPTKRVAIVIGNGAYNDTIGSLPNPINDAREVSSSLKKLGFTVFLATNATDDGLKACFSDAVKVLEKADVALMYYSGHGIQIQDENYLVGVNVETITPALKGFVPVQPLVDELQKRAAATLVFLDACRNNPFAETGRPGLSVSTSRNLKRVIGPDAAQPTPETHMQSRGLLVAYATSPNALALDGTGELSPFTAGFLKSILIPGYSIQRIMSDVTRNVGEATMWAQTPWIKSSLTHEVRLNGRYTIGELQSISELWARRSDELLDKGNQQEAIAAAIKGLPPGTGNSPPPQFAEAYRALATAYFSSRFRLPDIENVMFASISLDRQFAVLRRFKPQERGGIERVELWSVATQKLVSVLDEVRVEKPGSGIARISGDGRYVAAHIVGGRTRIWSTETLKVVADYKFTTDYISLRFTPRSKFLIIGLSNAPPLAWSAETQSIYVNFANAPAINWMKQAKIFGSRNLYLDVDDDGNVCVHASNSNDGVTRFVKLGVKMKSSDRIEILDGFDGEIESSFICGAHRGLILNSYYSVKRNEFVLRVVQTNGDAVRTYNFPISNWSGMELYFDEDSNEIATFDGSTINYQHGPTGLTRSHSVADLRYAPKMPGLYDHSGSRSGASIGFDHVELWPKQYGSSFLAEEAMAVLPDELQEEIAVDRIPSDLVAN